MKPDPDQSAETLLPGEKDLLQVLATPCMEVKASAEDPLPIKWAVATCEAGCCNVDDHAADIGVMTPQILTLTQVSCCKLSHHA